MYFLGTLEKILEGAPKVESKVLHEKKKEPLSQPNVKVKYKNFDENTGFNNKSKSFLKPKINNAYKEVTDNDIGDKKPKKKSNNCYGVYVRDGDTFEAMYNSKRVCFRLAGIDCPEINKPFSQEAREFLKSRILHKVVYLEFKGQDIYNREIVEAFEEKEMKTSINKQLLEEGLATSEKYRNNEGELTHNIIERVGNNIAEAGANFNDKGMWSDAPTTKVELVKVLSNSHQKSEPTAAPTSFKRKFPK